MPTKGQQWLSRVPRLFPASACSNLVLKGPLTKPKIHPYGCIDKYQVLSEKDDITVVDGEYCNWLTLKYGIPLKQTHGIVNPTEDSMIHQFVKFADPVHGDYDRECMQMADNALRQVLSPLIGACSFTSFDNVELNMAASCGYPLCTMYQDKGDAVTNAYDDIKWWVSEGWRTAPPQYIKLTGKVERLTLEEIKNLKCRAFQPDPTQIVIFEAQLNQDLISKFKELRGTFSAYGFNKWDGGWNNLFKHIEHFQYFFAGDVERWDKHYQPVHHDLNTALKKEFIKPEHRSLFNTDERFDYINEHAKKLHVLLWTGDIVELEQGQGSGRFTTTFDNILTHMRILYYHYFRVRKTLRPDLPVRTWEIREFYDGYVFGDDSCGGTDVPELASFEERQRSYNDCGFRLKLEDDFLSKSLDGIPFLGAKNGKYKGHHVFIMNPERVHGSLTALQKRLNKLESFERTMQLFMNCVFTELPYPGTEVPVWKVLYERVKHLHSQLPLQDLGAYAALLGIEVYRNYALGLETSAGVVVDSTVPFFTVDGHVHSIGEYHPGQSRDIKSGAFKESTDVRF